MGNNSNVISLKQRKMKKRFHTFLNKYKYVLIFVGIPTLLSLLYGIDKYLI